MKLKDTYRLMQAIILLMAAYLIASRFLFASTYNFNTYAQLNNGNPSIAPKNITFEFIKQHIDREVKKLKIYIPKQFGAEFNTYFEDKKINNCDHLGRINFGHNVLRRHDNRTHIGQFDTDQYSNDIIFYNRIIRDPGILVEDLSEANAVFIPFMAGAACRLYAYEEGRINDFKDLYDKIADWLESNYSAIKDKTIFMLYSRIEIEFSILICSMRKKTRDIMKKYKIHIFGIEEYERRLINYTFSTIPYATTTKFLYQSDQISYSYNLNKHRDIDTLFSGGPRGNIFRKTITENSKIQTGLNYYQFKNENEILFNKERTPSLSILFKFEKCELVRGILASYDWKEHTKFCFEPPGDSKTRRSFWDSIMNGCVPVIFTPLNLPFSDIIDYSQFVVQFDLSHINSVKTQKLQLIDLFEPYLRTEDWLINARNYMKVIRQFIQFTWMYDDNGEIIDSKFRYDAYGMLLARLASKL